jgi:DNA/RNA endonuclease YhcR with UshA esterase domain
MVAWETDWSYLDGECLLITGTVSLYEGIPEIEVRSSSQVEICN